MKNIGLQDKASSKSTANTRRLEACSHHPWICLLCVILGLIFSYMVPLFCLLFSGKSDPLDDLSSLELGLPELGVPTPSTDFKTALFLSVVIAIPLFVDTVLDCSYQMVNEEERILWYSKLLTLISITGPNLFLLMGYCGNLARTGYQYSIYNTRVTFGSCAMAYASQNALKYQMKDVSGCCLLLSIFCTITYSCRSLAYMSDPPMHRILDKITMGIRICGHCILFCLMCIWWRRSHLAKEGINFCDTILLVKLLAAVSCSWSCSAARYYYKSDDEWNTNSNCICAYAYITMIYTVIVITIPGRIARYEVNKATKALAQKKIFVSYISHEIRTPLNTVFLGLECVASTLKRIFAKERSDNVVSILETVNDVYSSCEIALSILNDLLMSDKMEGGKMSLDLECVNCCSYFTALAKPFNINARKKAITFNLDFSSLSVDTVVKVDKAKMGQVIRNLISNALKFTPNEGVVTVSITHKGRSNKSIDGMDTIYKLMSRPRHDQTRPNEIAAVFDDKIRVEVRDTGAGISSSNQKKLFGQYVQFDANKLQKGNGSGLGLWISKGITELHGGLIGAFSEGEGKGSTFYVELPVIIPDNKPVDVCYDDEQSSSASNTEMNKNDALREASFTEGLRNHLLRSQCNSPLSSLDNDLIDEHIARDKLLGPRNTLKRRRVAVYDMKE